jgi:hypothetical protein
VEKEPRTVTLPTAAWLAAIVFALLQIGLLALTLVDIERQRRIVDDQRKDLESVIAATKPRLEQAEPLLREARDALDPLRAAARRADALVRGLRETDAPGALAAVGDLAVQLAQRDRLAALVDRTDRLVADLQRAGTVGSVEEMRDIARRLLDLQTRAYETNRRSLATQLRAEAMLRESLAIQRETLEHARSLDRKTGPAPPLP